MSVVRRGLMAMMATVVLAEAARGEEFVVASAPLAVVPAAIEPAALAPSMVPSRPLLRHQFESLEAAARLRIKPLRREMLPRLALLPLPPVPAPKPPAPRRTLTLTIAGDLGLGGHMQPVRGDGALKHGSVIAWGELTGGIRPLIDGDLNFANLETAVTERNDLRPESKTFNFRSHPAGVRHLVGLGLNLLATANNHSMDFGAAGAFDTVDHLDRLLGTSGLKAHVGLGRNREQAGRPQLVEARGTTVAFSAVGIVTSGFPHHRAGDNRPGQMAYQSPEDFGDVTRRLAEAPSAYRILSVHQGIERQVQADATAVRKLRHEAVLARGIDLVAGHHAHVVQGIELLNGRLIFYGLGNFLHPGMQNMGSLGACRDYGLFARLHLASDETGHLRARAVEVIALTDMHYRAKRMDATQGAERVAILNYLAGGLDDAATGARGLRFAAQGDGSGLYCADGAAQEPGRIGQLCRAWRGPDAVSATQRSRAQASCGYVASQSARAREQPGPQAVSAPQRGQRRAEATPVMVGGE